MSQRIICHTLFNITQTGVINRGKPNTDNVIDWQERRNTQCNFDTILQVISLRSQPEVTRIPIKLRLTENEINNFGYYYDLTDEHYYYSFDFEVQHTSVFENGVIPLGALYNDCVGVPMIRCLDQYTSLPDKLDVSNELRNIYFEEA